MTANNWILYGRETPRGTMYGLMKNSGADTGPQFPTAGAAREYALNGPAPIVGLLVEHCK